VKKLLVEVVVVKMLLSANYEQHDDELQSQNNSIG